MKKTFFLLLLSLLLPLWGNAQVAGDMDTSFNPTDTGNGKGDGVTSQTNAIAIQTDGKIVIGGFSSTYNGTATNYIARLNADGTLDTNFTTTGSGLNGAIKSIAFQSDGKIIIGGYFTTYNGTTANHIARLNTDGTLDTTFTMGTGASDNVNSIAVQTDGKIVITGYFTSYNGTATKFIARLNTNGTFDNTLNTGTGLGSPVSAFAIQTDGKIVIGGGFTTYNGSTVSKIIRLNTNGSLDTTFTGTGANDSPNSIAIQADGKIIIGGYFTAYNGTAVNKIARLNANGTLDTAFNAGGTGTNNSVNAIAILSDGKIIIGGDFTTFNGTTTNKIARLNTDGTLDTTFATGTGADSGVNIIARQADDKIIVGDFTSYNGTVVPHITRLKTDGAIDTTFNANTGANSGVYTIARQADGKMIIAGYFNKYNGTNANRIARLNTDGTFDTTFATGTGPGSNVSSVVIQADGKIIIGGDFTTFNGTAAKYIARLNTDGTLDTTFNAGGVGADNSVKTIELQNDGKIIILGWFNTYNGIASKNVARLNADGSLDTTYFSGTGTNGSVINAVARQADGKIVFVGGFNTYNGTSANRIARLNTDGTLDTTFSTVTGANNNVFSIAIQADGKIIIGGYFTTYKGTTANRIARLNTNGSLDTTFTGTGVNGVVRSIAIQADGKIIIVGDFTTYNGTTANYVARINTDGTLDTTFATGAGTNYSVAALALQTDGKVIIGGEFTNYKGTGRNRIARLFANITTAPINNTIVNITSSMTADVVADGTTVSGSTTANFDGGGQYLMSSTFSQFGAPTSFLPNGNTFTSAQTASVSYTLAPYTGNNSLRISNTNSGTINVNMASNFGAKKLYVLASSGSGSCTANFTINFSDGTSQSVSGVGISDWFSGTNYALSGFGRTSTTSIDNFGDNPRLYEIEIAINSANQAKKITSIVVAKTTSNGILNVMGLSYEKGTQILCSGTTIADLQMNGTNIKWYAAAAGGSSLSGSVVLTNNTTYYASQTVAGIESVSRTALTVLLNSSTTPTFSAVSPICSGTALSTLPTTSTNGIAGLWSPALNNAATTIYTFTPTAGQCASTATLGITVHANVTYYADTDGDTYGNAAVTQVSCTGAPTGYVANSTDCDDTKAAVHFGAIEILDGIDNNCDGNIDEGVISTSKVKANLCGATLSSLNANINADYIAGYQAYRFEITKGTTVQTLEVNKYNFSLTQVPGITYSTTYGVRVAVKMGGNWGGYGTSCDLTTPTLSSSTVILTKISSTFCSSTLAALDTKIPAVTVYAATGYRFEITTGGATTVYDSPTYNFRLAQAGVAAFGTNYSIRVAAQVNGVYGNYGESCTVTTPILTTDTVPTTTILPSLCGTTLASKESKITAVMITGATNGRYEITKAGSAPVVYEVASTVIKLSQTGVVVDYNTAYAIRVAAFVGGVWGNYGASCTVTTPAAPIARLKAKTFEVFAYPNPFDSNFKLNIETPSKEEVTIAVYDMIGKLIETHQVNPTEVANLQIGNNFVAGIYNVIVSQANEMQAIRLIRK